MYLANVHTFDFQLPLLIIDAPLLLAQLIDAKLIEQHFLMVVIAGGALLYCFYSYLLIQRRWKVGVIVLLLHSLSVVVMVPPPRNGPEHIFQLDQKPQFLTDQLALDMARRTLSLDGFNVSQWIPYEGSLDGWEPTLAPDGTAYRYIWLDKPGNPNYGKIAFRKIGFRDRPRNAFLDVYVIWENNRVRCHHAWPRN